MGPDRSPFKKHDPYKLCGVCTFLTEVPHKMHGGHTKCTVATQNTRHFLFFTITVESFVWEEAIRVCTRLLSRVGSHHIMRISMHGASLTLSHMFLIFNLVQLISMRIDDHPESG
jgi:hypothetical protein